MYAQLITDIKLEITSLQSSSDNISDAILSEHEETEIMRILSDTKNSSDGSTTSSEIIEETSNEFEQIEKEEIKEIKEPKKENCIKKCFYYNNGIK